MNDGNNDFLAFVQELLQLTSTLRPTNCCRYLHKLFDGVFDLLVQIDTVSHDNNRIKDFFAAVIFQCDKLMCQPRNGIGFTGTGAVLNQISTTNTVTLRIAEQRFYHGKLMVTREHLLIFCNTGVFVLLRDDLSIVFDDVGELILGQNLFPKIIRFDSIGVRRIACTVIEAFVER